MAGSRRPTQAQLRERRARIAAVVLGVGFLGVAVIQGPKLLKMISGGSSSSPSASTTTSTTPGTAGSATTASPTSAAAGTSLGSGQLNGFSLFNPVVVFKPIPKQANASATTTTSGKASPASPKPAPASTTTTATPQPSPTKATTTTSPAVTPAATSTPAPPVTFTVPSGVPAAVVKVNGKEQLFGAGATFPKEAPLFKLAVIAKKGLKISVLGGTFIDGQPYLLLRQGNKVTLLNQSDGTKFVIMYVKKTFAPANALTSPTQTAASATTPAAPSPTVPAASSTTTAG